MEGKPHGYVREYRFVQTDYREGVFFGYNYKYDRSYYEVEYNNG